MFVKSLKALFTIKRGGRKTVYSSRLTSIVFNYRYLHEEKCDGLNIWDENLTQDTKLRIEAYWKDKLQYSEFDPSREDEKFYILSMFPYPSGNLHMGHIRVYSISDTLARFYRMMGKNVLHPMGWDAFGLPAENAAIERGLSSESWTANNISTMREQLKQFRCTFDWHREISTCHKDYYKFTQVIFLKMYEQGLAYQKKALVNWDPIDKTVLADEQVDEQGRSWRSGAKVEKKILKHWFIQTTAFAKALHDGLDRKDLEDWRDIINLQKHWIGTCDGVSFEFALSGQDGEVTLWTDKPEHLARAEFVAVSPGSVLDLESEGSGNRQLNVHVVNSLTGQLLPVYVTDQLLFHRGSDARIGIPDVYEEDFEFAKSVNLTLPDTFPQAADSVLERETVIEKIKGRITSSKIRDWLISRQRHWGTPIPMVHCGKCGVQPVPYDQLPVELPSVDRVSERGAQLFYPEQWFSTSCPKCGGPAHRDLDTMDTFVDSSWYYLRYIDPHNQHEPFRPSVASKVMPVDIYVGGKEHAVLHLYYARFVSYFLHSLGWLPDPEPFKRLVVQGMVMGKTCAVKSSGKYIPASQVDFTEKKPVEKETGEPVVVSWDKMSKSKYNGVDPEDMLKVHGIDTTRLLMLAQVAPTSQRNWDDSLFPGVINWQYKIWLTLREFMKARSSKESVQSPTDLADIEAFYRQSRNYHLKSISTSYQVAHQFNTVIATMHGLVADLRKHGAAYKAHSVEYERSLAMLFVTLSPLAPHFAAQLWSGLQRVAGLQTTQEYDWSKPVYLQKWPAVDRDYPLNLTCKINTAVKDKIKLRREELDQLTVSSATELALSSAKVREYTDQSPVLDSSFKLYPGLHAAIDLSIDPTKLHFDKEFYKKNKKKRVNH